jgi:phospholipase/carboxylesterase
MTGPSGDGPLPDPITRRRFVELAAMSAGAAITSAIATSCGFGSVSEGAASELTPGRLTARPGTASGSVVPGLRPLGVGAARDGLLYIPRGYSPDRPSPLAVMLHGAGGSARGGIRPFETLADDAGLILVVPESRRSTWDAIRGDYGADVAFIDRVLAAVFRDAAVDPARVTVGGFSDGASYALGLGMTNGELFRRIVAFSPGFVTGVAAQGKPSIFISHGTRDAILPIDQCSRRIVPELQRAGYDVEYREFDGPHAVPPNIARDASAWLGVPAK